MKKLFFILLIFTGSMFWSCTDFLDTPVDNRTEINSKEKIAQLLVSAYPSACYASFLFPRTDYIADKGAGTDHVPNSNSFFWRDVTTTSQDSPTYFWNACYYSIAEANRAIMAADELSGTPGVEAYKGEALLIRAFSHFLLVNIYAKYYDVGGENDSPGIPYVEEAETTVIKKYSRGTVAEVYEKIERDMLDGLALLGSDDMYAVPRFHFTQKAAHAFAARFYLYKGEWQKLIDHANEVIPRPTIFTASGNVAANDGATIYANNNFQPWTKSDIKSAPSSEAIKILWNSGANPSHLLLKEMTSYLAQYANTWRYGTSQAETNATVNAANVTGGTWAYKTYSSSSTHYYNPKFYSFFVRTSISATTGTYSTTFSYFRQEEALLNRAEAYAMLGMYDEAIADLNVFARQRIYTTSTVAYDEDLHVINMAKVRNFYATQVTDADHYFNVYKALGSDSWETDKKCLIQCILDFKRNEFMWEGLRYWDVLRYKIPVTHTRHVTAGGETNTLYPGDDRWVIQIPSTALLSDVELNPRENLLSKEW